MRLQGSRHLFHPRSPSEHRVRKGMPLLLPDNLTEGRGGVPANWDLDVAFLWNQNWKMECQWGITSHSRIFFLFFFPFFSCFAAGQMENVLQGRVMVAA